MVDELEVVGLVVKVVGEDYLKEGVNENYLMKMVVVAEDYSMNAHFGTHHRQVLDHRI